jgi:hypothetical protein
MALRAEGIPHHCFIVSLCENFSAVSGAHKRLGALGVSTLFPSFPAISAAATARRLAP